MPRIETTPVTSGKLTTDLGHWCYAHPQEAADKIEKLRDGTKRALGNFKTTHTHACLEQVLRGAE
jgi:hypothetical protein